MTRLTDKLLTTANRYCDVAHLSLARVSTLIFGDGMRLKGIVAGKDLGTRSYERAMTWFAANWPDGVDWPEGIERPSAEAKAIEPDAEPHGAAA